MGKMIYVAGPYTDDGHFTTRMNVLKASEKVAQCFKKGWTVYSPHRTCDGFEYIQDELGLDHDKWTELFLEAVKRSDAILMVGDWNKSDGSKEEYKCAKKNGLDIYHSVEEIPNLREDDEH